VLPDIAAAEYAQVLFKYGNRGKDDKTVRRCAVFPQQMLFDSPCSPPDSSFVDTDQLDYTLVRVDDEGLDGIEPVPLWPSYDARNQSNWHLSPESAFVVGHPGGAGRQSQQGNLRKVMEVDGIGLHSFPFRLNLSLLCPFPLNLS